jgi:quercetin dioxygenase-like cupin family protein
LEFDSAKPTEVGSVRSFFKARTATLDELEMHVTTLKPGKASHPPHRHPNEELIIVMQGTVETLSNGEWKRVGPGSVIFNASNQLHGLRNVGRRRGRLSRHQLEIRQSCNSRKCLAKAWNPIPMNVACVYLTSEVFRFDRNEMIVLYKALQRLLLRGRGIERLAREHELMFHSSARWLLFRYSLPRVQPSSRCLRADASSFETVPSVSLSLIHGWSALAENSNGPVPRLKTSMYRVWRLKTSKSGSASRPRSREVANGDPSTANPILGSEAGCTSVTAGIAFNGGSFQNV